MVSNRISLIVVSLIAFAILLTACGASGSEPTPTATSSSIVQTSLDWSKHVDRPHDDKAELISIPGGTFTMGNDEPNAEADQTPAHEVSVAAFQIYSHEVTNAMYATCVENQACMAPGIAGTPQMRHFIDPTYMDHPVVGVDWNMAADYCEWVGGRLPTEAEWEFAASGTTGSAYPWGNDLPTCDVLNMRGCFNPGNTAPGGSYPDGRSPFGIYDMSGNVWEWVYDWYQADSYNSSPTNNPFGPNEGSEKIVRGGSYLTRPERVRTSTRQMASPIQGFNDVGFRCVKTETGVPDSMSLPPEGHSPITPEEGVESEPPFTPMEGIDFNLLGTGFDCIDLTAGTFRVVFNIEIILPTAEPDHATVEIEDPSGDVGSSSDCSIVALGGGRYMVGCTANLPPGLDLGGLPIWVNATLFVIYTDPSFTAQFTAPMEINTCLGVLPAGFEANASLSCPDAAGLSTLEIDQTHSEVPDMLDFDYNGMLLDPFCTDLYADHISCTGITATADPLLMMWVRYPGSDTVASHSIPISQEECPEVDYSFRANAICSDGGGYAIVVTATPVIAGSWEVTGENVTITSNGLVAADTMHAFFNELPPPGENIQYRVCIDDGSGGPLYCYVEETPQPECTPPASFLDVQLDAFGCDPDSENFFASFTHTVTGLDPAFLTVANNITPMSCSVLAAPPNTIYCGSAMSPLISQIAFSYTEPGRILTDSWTIVVEPCQVVQVIPCSDYLAEQECKANGCIWTQKMGPCHP